MKIYLVGGAVRDHLLARIPKDRDYVVVGSTPEEMISLGYQQVGSSFPVFLKDGNEYALARTERKSGPGYKGFDVVYDPHVTLQEDLERRDLTINSMAMNLDTGEIIDPFNGAHDLSNELLRATSNSFSEDPVRVLRTARFAARYGFRVVHDTLTLMHTVAPELAHVPQERIWAEFEKGLGEPFPVKMMNVLESSGALWTPALTPYRGWSGLLKDVTDEDNLEVRFALLARSFHDQDYETCRIPKNLVRVSKSVNRHLSSILDYVTLDSHKRLQLLMDLRAFNGLDHLLTVLRVAKHHWVADSVVQAIHDDIKMVLSVDLPELAKKSPTSIKDTIFNARVKAMMD